MRNKTPEKYKVVAAKRRLKVAQSLPDEYFPLAGHLLMSSLEDALALAHDPNEPLQERKIAALVIELVRSGDWGATSILIDRAISYTEGKDAA